MSGLKGAECRKFQANIFNKSKCTNCFKQREEHSPEALESNRASRKVSKCGYLFVAPDWDFAIPLNRTKRWQRRWFVLYDDGELTYCLDDHPATIPQGVVDMNRVLEVSNAEEVTGNQFSLAITAPDRVTFIKATCKEEAKWWMDVLSVLTCTLKQGRHKRNATFPGIKTTTAKQTRHTAATMAPTAFETAAGQRVRFHSCTTDPMLESRPQSAPAPTLEAEEDVFPTKDSSPPASSTLQSSTHSSTNTSRCFSTPISTSTPLSSLPPSSTPFSSLPPSSARLLREEHKENTPYCGDYTDNPPTSESPPTQDKMSHKLRVRRTPRRTEGRGVGLTQPRSKSEVSGMFHPTPNCPLARHQPPTTTTTTTVIAAATAAVTTSNTTSGALTGCSVPLATTNLRADGDTNSNLYPEEGLPSSVALSARGVPLSHSCPAGGALHPPSHSVGRQNLPSSSLGSTNICLPPSLVSTSLHSAWKSSKPTLHSSCGSITSSSSPSTSTSTSGAPMTYSPNSSSFSSSTTRQVASSLLPSSPLTANPLKPFFKESRGRRRATIDVASSLTSLTSFPSFATPSSSSSTSSTPFFPPLGLNSYSTSYLAGYKRGSLGGTATPPLLSHSLSSSTLGLAMHAPLPSRPLPRASTPPARPAGEVSRRQLITDLEETKREEKLKDIADSLTRPRGSSSLAYVSSKPGAGDVKPTRESDAAEEVDPPPSSAHSQSQDTTPPSHPDHVRGDPDGCGLELSPPYPASPDLQRVDLPAEDLLYIKKGWLMKQSLSQEWIKYWFVLRGTGLMFYRDPGAEDSGILAGIIDLSLAKSIEESEVARNYGFIVATWEEKKYIFSAVTSGIRANWVQALRNAANLKEQKDRPLTLGEKIEREIVAKKGRTNSQGSTFESMAAERERDTNLHAESRSSSTNSHFVFSSEEEGEDDEEEEDDDDEEEEEEEYCTASETSSSARFHQQTSEDLCDWSNTRPDISTKQSRSSPMTSRRTAKEDYLTTKLAATSTPATTTTTTTTTTNNNNSSSSGGRGRDVCCSETGSLHSISDLDDRLQPEKDGPIGTSTSTIPASGDALLVDLLETQVESLKAKLEQTQQPLSGRSKAKLELDLTDARQNVTSLKTDLNRLRKRLEMCEGDLDRSEREADQLKRDKEDVVQDRTTLQRRASKLEIQVKELLDRVEEQEHDLSEKAAATNQLNELRKKYGELLEHFSAQQAEVLAGLDWKQQYTLLEKKSLKERNEWEERLGIQEKKFMELSGSQEARHQDVVRRLNRSLQEAEKKVHTLVSELEDERTSSTTPRKLSSSSLDTDVRQQNQQLSMQLEHLTTELSRMRETLKSEKSEVYKWKDLVKELRSLLDGKNDEIERKREELDEVRTNLKATHRELDHTTDRLQRGIEENENLCAKVRELERSLRQDKERRASSNLSISSSRERFTSKKALPRIDSLSDLTNVDLTIDPEEMNKEQLVEHCGEVRVRLERAVGEIRTLKRQMRDGQDQQDQLELSNLQLRQDMKGSQGDFTSQLNLMTCRVQDLTNKLTNSEKQVRILRQKMSRAESRDRRRTQSLKGRESFTLSRDMEAKLGQLEAKMEQMVRPQDESGLQEVEEERAKVAENAGVEGGKVARRSRSFEESTKSSRLRRKSLDSPGSSDAMKAIVRLNALEAKMSDLTSGVSMPAIGVDNTSLTDTTPSTTSKASTRPRSPTHSATSPLRSVPHSRSPIRSPSVPRKTLRSPRTTPEKTTKVSRSDSENRHLRERLGALDKVLTSLQTQLGECVSWAGAVECVCSCGAPGLSSLQQRLGGALHLAQLRHSSVDQTEVARVQPLALKLQDMLRDKLAELAARRDHLKNDGKWTRDVQVKVFAERLAYETLVLSQLAQVMQATQRPQMYEASARLQELVEAHRKLSFLEKKLTNPDFDMDTLSPLDFYTSLLAEKLVVQGEVANPSSRRASTAPPPALGKTCRDLQTRLLERERNLAGLLTRYKEEKLHHIAVVMAKETITGTGPGQDDTVLVEEVRMRQVWTMAQELVSQELANTEAAQSLLRLSHLLSPDGPPPAGASPWPTAAALERYHRAAEDSLRQEMEEAVFTLSNKYEAVLARHRAGDAAVLESVSVTMDALLAEFAAVAAQKAVIDGQLAVVQGEGGEVVPETLAIVEEVKDTVGSASDVVASEAHLLMFLGGRDSSLESLVQPALDQAEFTFMYNKATKEGAAEVAKLLQNVAKSQASPDVIGASSLSTSTPSITSTTTTTTSSNTNLTTSKDRSGESSAAVSAVAKTPSSPKVKRKSEGRRSSRRSSDITGMTDGCRQCEELRQEVAKLKRSMDLRRAREREVECKQCLAHLATIKALEEEHQAAVAALKAQHQQELACVGALEESSGGPVSTTDGELTELQRRLSLLEEGYEAQITALKHQYEEALGSQPDLCEEKVRQRYQLEIEHLRGLCEKGLGAMENSHKRMLMEMEEKHCRELAALQAEKEQALAEETQATLAALDAMRKAHESEVQREIAKFKEEFIRKMQSSHDLSAIHKEHEAEMEDIRREILSLSQKYSVKCLESASLEEKLDALNRQLNDVNKQLFDLQARNKQLKAHLSVQVSQLQVEGKRDAESQLKLCEAELGLMKEEVARLTQQLHQTQTNNGGRRSRVSLRREGSSPPLAEHPPRLSAAPTRS